MNYCTGAPRHLTGNVQPVDPKQYYFMYHNIDQAMLKNQPPFRKLVFLIYTFLPSAAGGLRHRIMARPEGRADVVAATFRGKMAGHRSCRAFRARAANASGGASA